MISKILVPTDGSTAAQKAAKYAIQLGKQLKASIFVLSVIDKRSLSILHTLPYSDGKVSTTIPMSASSRIRIMESAESYLLESANKHAEKIKKLCKQNHLSLKTLTTIGHPVEDILNEAKRLKVDLIIIGSRGHSALVSSVLGSVAYGVIHHESKIPVMVVK